MEDTEFAYEVELKASQEDAITRVTDALKSEGFGVLTRIDMDKAFKEKLGADFRPYTILGACNPALANTALTSDARVGLFLPCNVTVEALTAAQARVRITNPETMMRSGGFDKDATIKSVGSEAATLLKRVANKLKE